MVEARKSVLLIPATEAVLNPAKPDPMEGLVVASINELLRGFSNLMVKEFPCTAS